MILTFDAQTVRNFIEASRNSSNHRATIEQSCMEEYLRDGLDPESLNDMLDGTVAGDYDPARIPEGVWLVGDLGGVYLTSNAPVDEVRAAGFDPVVYACEVDPETMGPDEVYKARKDSFGIMDGVKFIAAEHLEQALDDDVLGIDVTPDFVLIPGTISVDYAP